MKNSEIALDIKLFKRLLVPSSVSTLISLFIGLAVTLGVVFFSRYQSSGLRREYLYYQAHHTASTSTFTNSLLQNNVVSNIPLFLFWALVGIVVYLIAADVVKSIMSTMELRREMTDYVHVNRSSLITTIVEQLIVRVVVIAVWLPYIIYFIHKIIPYVVSLSIVSTTQGRPLLEPAYISLGILIIWVSLHIHLILLRLLFLRPRLLSDGL